MNRGIINRLGNQEYPMGSVLVNENYKQKIIEDIIFPDEYKKWKTKVNGFWALKLNKEDQIRTTEYVNIFNQDIFEEFEDDIVYIDTDCIFLKNYNDKLFNKIKDINLSFDKCEVKYLWVERNKSIIYVDDSGMVERGFGSSTYREKASIIKRKINNTILSKSRNAKINEILKI